jgi:hypothetical protein
MENIKEFMTGYFAYSVTINRSKIHLVKNGKIICNNKNPKGTLIWRISNGYSSIK